MKPNTKPNTPADKAPDTPHMLRTQCILCGVILLAALLIRLIGGGAFAWLRGTVNGALEDDSLLTALSRSLYGTTTTTITTVATITPETTATTTVGTTAATTAAATTAATTTHVRG